jgi:hypothetical protein
MSSGMTFILTFCVYLFVWYHMFHELANDRTDDITYDNWIDITEAKI